MGYCFAFDTGALLLGKHQIVPDTKTILEKERRATTLDVAFSHDADPVTEDVSLIHVMSREDDYATLLILLDHLPEASSRRCVHTRGRLV